MALFRKIFSWFMTILVVVTIFAMIDYFAAIALQRDATIAYFFWEMIIWGFTLLFWVVKFLFCLVAYPIVLTIPGIEIHLGEQVKDLWELTKSLFGLFLCFCGNSLTEVFSVIKDLIILVFNLLPNVDIPDDATAITLGMLFNIDQAPSKPNWVILKDTTWESIVNFILDPIYNIAIIKFEWLNDAGGRIGEWLLSKVKTPSEILWLDVFNMSSVPDWFSNTTLVIVKPEIYVGDGSDLQFGTGGGGGIGWSWDDTQQQYTLVAG